MWSPSLPGHSTALRVLAAAGESDSARGRAAAAKAREHISAKPGAGPQNAAPFSVHGVPASGTGPEGALPAPPALPRLPGHLSLCVFLGGSTSNVMTALASTVHKKKSHES